MINLLKKKRNTLDDDPCCVTIMGEPASKSNSRRLVMFHGRPRFIKSKKAIDYTSLFNKQIGTRKVLLEGDLCIGMKIFYSSKRPDLDETLILDLLQEKVYTNDRQIKIKYIEWGLDKENPRCIIVCGSVDQKDLVLETLGRIKGGDSE